MCSGSGEVWYEASKYLSNTNNLPHLYDFRWISLEIPRDYCMAILVYLILKEGSIFLLKGKALVVNQAKNGANLVQMVFDRLL